MERNFWRRMYVRRETYRTIEVRVEGEVRQKSDISERRSKGWRGGFAPSTLTLFATRPLGHCTTCKGSSYTKNGYNLFHQKVEAEYFAFNNFFLKKASIFWENCEKLFWEHNWQFFREMRRLAPKINITFFTKNKVLNILFSSFFKPAVFSEKTTKNRFWGASLFWREGGVWRRKRI